jgi:hypothetical protein
LSLAGTLSTLKPRNLQVLRLVQPVLIASFMRFQLHLVALMSLLIGCQGASDDGKGATGGGGEATDTVGVNTGSGRATSSAGGGGSGSSSVSTGVGGAPEDGVAAVCPGQGFCSLPNTRIRPLCAAESGFPDVHGASGCVAITKAWNGGAFDSRRNRLIVLGGGHNDYYGNELYAIDLGKVRAERLTDPGLPIAPTGTCVPSIVNDTQPNARHTYGGVAYLENIDALFVSGGSLACAEGAFGDDAWLYHFGSKSWERRFPSGPNPLAGPGMMTAYDAASGTVYVHDREHLYAYDPIANSYDQLTSDRAYMGYHLEATIDPVGKRFIIAGYDGVADGGRVYSYSIDPQSDYTISEWNTSGGAGLIGAVYPGLAFHPPSGKLVAWGEDTPEKVFSLDLTNRTWSSEQMSSPPAPVGNGTHGRWRYSATSQVFVLANSVDDDVVVYRP